MNNQKKRQVGQYRNRMIIVFSIYTLLVLTSKYLDSQYDLSLIQRILLSVLPVVPAATSIFVMINFVRTMDEVWQRIISESTLISAGVVGVVTFTLGFLEGVIELPDGILIFVLPAMFMVYGVALPLVRMRYT